MSGGNGLLASPLPEHIVFRSPVGQSPIPGAGDPADADDFGADFRELSEMEPDRPATGAIEGRGGRPAPIMTVFGVVLGRFPRLRVPGPCGKDRRALLRSFGRFSYPGHAAVAQW
jgi:hypothetical protein